MRRPRLLSVLSVASVGVLPVLFCGFFIEFGLALTRFQPTTPQFRDVSVQFDRGRVVCWLMKTDIVAGAPSPSTTLHWRGNFSALRQPHLRRSLWEFDANPLPIPPASHAFILACPISGASPSRFS
jgi:hypothetical protein